MIVPVAEQASQQVGTPQERAVFRSRAAHHHVVAAAGSGVLSIQHEFLRAQAALAREIVERGSVCRKLIPRFRRMNVDFDDAGIGRHFQNSDPDIVGRSVAFEQHRHFKVCGGIFDGGHQVQIVAEVLDRRHEDE